MINARSRYRDSTVAKVTDGNGTLQLAIIPSAAQPFAVNYTYYAWARGDRVDSLASRFFGDPTLWWNIGDANPEILDWTEVDPGTVIRIPDA